MKELDLGRELLNKAVNGITAQHLKDIVDAKDLTNDDKSVIQIMHGLIEVAADKENEGIFTWDQTHTALNENPYRILHNLRSFAENSSSQNIQGPRVRALKDRFIQTTQDAQFTEKYIEAVREFLCEGFCFIDILDEINLLKSPEKRRQDRSSFPIDTSMQQFASPSSEVHRVGIDVNMISPIPNRDDRNLGGASVN